MKKVQKKKNSGKFIKTLSRLIDNHKEYHAREYLEMKKIYSDSELISSLSKLILHPIIGRYIKNQEFPKTFKNLGSTKVIHDSIPVERLLLWYAITIRNYSKDLQGFLDQSILFERSVLLSNYDESLKILDYIEDIFGVSTWSIENRIALLELTSGLEKEKEFRNKIVSDRNVNIYVRILVNYYSMRSERNISHSWFTSNLNEFLGQDLTEELGEYFLFKLNPFTKHEYKWFQEILLIDERMSIIDKFHTFIRIVQYIVTICDDQSIKNSVERLVRQVYSKIDDQRLANILLVLCNDEYSRGDKDTRIIHALDAYTIGEYNNCIILCEDILHTNPECVDIYEIYLKSLMSINQELIRRDNYLTNILSQLLHIYNKTNKFIEAYQGLMKLITIHSSNNWANQIYGLIAKAYSFESRPRQPNESISILYSKSNNPILSLLSKGIISNNSSKTTLLYKYLKENNRTGIESLGLPDYRRMKYSAMIEKNLGDYEKSRKYFQQMFDSQSDLLHKQDAIVGLVQCYVGMGNLNPCIELVVDTLFQNENLYVIIPFEILLEKIESTRLQEVPISLPIVYDMYSKYVSNNKDSYKFEAYEDFLFHLGLQRPSELETLLGNIEKRNIVYFLNNICTIDLMKYSTVFSTLEDVERERIYVYQLLIKIDPDNRKIYLEEIKKFTQQMIVRKGIRQIEENKIHVDTVGIKRSLEKTMHESYQRYLALKEIDSEVPDYIPIKTLDSNNDYGLTQVMATGNKYNSLQMMIFELRDAFVSSNAYGLNGYLSMGFRHGTLSGQLRSSLIAEHLITPKNNKTNVYHSNDYWNDLYKELPPLIKNKLKELLDAFSRGVDDLIGNVVGQWIQINTEKNPGKGMFNFHIFIDDMEELKGKLASETTFDEFVELVFDKLWSMTDQSLTEIKERVETELKPIFNDMFDQLQKGIDKLGGNIGFTEMKNSITRARTAIQHDLDRIITWFNRSNMSDVADYFVNLPIDIAIAIVRYTNPNNTINIAINTEISRKLKGKTLKGFVDIFYTLLDNIKYSLLDETTVSIDVDIVGSVLTISCENNLSDEVDVFEARKRLDQIKANINSDFSLDKVSDEGGTGLYKIMKILNIDLQSPSNLAYSFTDRKTFIVTISIEEGELFV